MRHNGCYERAYAAVICSYESLMGANMAASGRSYARMLLALEPLIEVLYRLYRLLFRYEQL